MGRQSPHTATGIYGRHTMHARSFTAPLSRLTLAALIGTLIASLSAGPAVAADPPATSPPSATSPTTSLALPNGAPLKPGDEVIQSWTVVPGGDGQRAYFSYDSDGGVTIEDSVSVQNYGNVSLNLRVYATDGINNPDGSFALLSGDQKPVDVGSWIKLAQENVTIPAGKQVLIPYTVTIPAGADPGDHVGGIVASNEMPTKVGKENTLLVFRRTGVRLYLRVHGQLRSNLATEAFRVSYKGGLNPSNGKVSVRFRIANLGNVRQAGSYHLTVEGAFGTGKHDLGERAFPELLPGQSIELAEDVRGVPALFVAKASVIVTPKAGGDEAASQPTRRSAQTFAPPLLPLLILLLLLAFLVAWRIVHHYRNPGDSDAHEGDEGPGDGSSSDDQESVLV